MAFDHFADRRTNKVCESRLKLQRLRQQLVANYIRMKIFEDYDGSPFVFIVRSCEALEIVVVFLALNQLKH